ncbi:hypothetical protein ED236_00635 [Pseudomethylobacillus aquaticus]|uniref:Anti-sigma K factor RskA C-terminal domain-containing protein n=1 Tax=Pseudomethylobacillus aquaticus TaxID=2676064 RepID=A0A3N0V622_9PROT|nr:anti-sigma factor [Pseudomethylobacillus aquaticus]ROH88031.1 hypothetical protein ED236_00635 [Pseudomethylobacillus aquaticus]
MRYDKPELRDMLAAKYALGTLRGAARLRFEHLVLQREDWQNCTDWWLMRVSLLADTVVAVKPASSVWRDIDRRLFPAYSRTRQWWRTLALGFSAVSALLLVLLINPALNPLQPPAQQTQTSGIHIALLADTSAQPGWLLTLSQLQRQSQELRVASLPGLQVQADKAYELWLLPADQSAPVSIGLLPQQGKASLSIKPELAAQLLTGALAVSVEPPGGSPSGQPTGAVLYQGKIGVI